MKRLIAAMLVAGGALASAPAQAQEIQLRGPLAGARSVSRLVQYRAGRVSLTPTVGITLQDEFSRDMFFGLRADYHLTDWFGFGVWGAASVTIAGGTAAADFTFDMTFADPGTGNVKPSELPIDNTSSPSPRLFVKLGSWQFAVHRVTGPGPLQLGAHQLFGAAVGVGDRGQVRFGVDPQVEGLEPRHHVRGPLLPRTRDQRKGGRRRPPWRALRKASRPHARIHRHHSQGLAGRETGS